MERSILIAGYYGAGNLGDEAILCAIRAGLERVAPGFRATVVSRDPGETAHTHGVGAIAWGDLPALIDAARACDLVVVGGGGLFQDHWGLDPETLLRRSAGGIPAYAGPLWLARIVGRPSLLWSVGVGPLRSEAARRETARAFALASAASVRDEESAALVRAALAEHPQPSPPELVVAADPAFALPVAAGDEAEAGRLLAELGLGGEEGFVAVSLRHWEGAGPPIAWLPGVVSGLERALETLPEGARALLIPLQARGPSVFEDDLPVLRAAHSRFVRPGRAVLLPEVPRPAVFAALVARARAVVAMRLHAALLALRAGVAPVALVYDAKVASLMRSASLGDWAVGLEACDAHAVASRVGRALVEVPGRRAEVTRFAAEMASRALAPEPIAATLLARPPEPLDPRIDWLRAETLEWILRVERLDREAEHRRAPAVVPEPHPAPSAPSAPSAPGLRTRLGDLLQRISGSGSGPSDRR